MNFVLRKRINKKSYGINKTKNGVKINFSKLYLHVGKWNAFNIRGVIDWNGNEKIIKLY